MAIRRILVPTDFSAPSQEAADYAATLADSLGAEIILVFVEGIFTYGVSGDLMGSAAAIRFFEEHRKAARNRLEALKKRLTRDERRVRAVFTKGVPSQAIAAVATKVRADLIIMATHGRTGLSSLLLGSVASNVVRDAPCPVLTLRPGKTRSRATRRGRKTPKQP